MLTSSALVLEEKLDKERAALSKKKSELNLTKLTDDVTVNGIPWSELKYKLISKDFDFYSFWVSKTICLDSSLQFRNHFLLRRKKF